METSPLTKRLAGGLLAVLALAAAACSDSRTGNASNISMNATTTTEAPAPGTASIPVTLTTDESGTTRAIVHVRVGGGPSVPVILDTGSTGLRILPKGVGPSTQTSKQSETVTFGGGVQMTSAEATAPVSIGSLSTPSTTVVSLIQSTSCAPGFPSCAPGAGAAGLFGTSGAVGILGVAMTDGMAATVPYSPLLQLRAPYRDGFTLSLPTDGRDLLTLGLPHSTSTTVAIPLVPAIPATYPDGVPAWQKDVELCWTIHDDQHGCGSTDLDTGSPTTVITPTGIPGIPATGGVSAGYPIAVATPRSIPIWEYNSSATPGYGLTLFAPLPGTTQFNTGIGFFTSHVVGYDVLTGQIFVTPQ